VPIYEYVCEACGRLTELMQKVSDPPPATCPACGEARMAKVVSRTSFHLKGGGWYSDLYASAGQGKAKADTAQAGGKAKPGGDAKPGADAKPAAPAAPAPAPSGGAAGGSTAGGGDKK